MLLWGERDLFRRLPGAVRKDPELLLKVRGAPWAPCGGETGPNVAVNLDPVVPLEQLQRRPVAPVPAPRRLDNRENVELARRSCTAGIPRLHRSSDRGHS